LNLLNLLNNYTGYSAEAAAQPAGCGGKNEYGMFGVYCLMFVVCCLWFFDHTLWQASFFPFYFLPATAGKLFCFLLFNKKSPAP
jgi:hypothetical protein